MGNCHIPKWKGNLPEVFCEKTILKNFAEFTGKHILESLFVDAADFWPATLLKRDSDAGASCHFEKLFRTSPGGCIGKCSVTIYWMQSQPCVCHTSQKYFLFWEVLDLQLSDLRARNTKFYFVYILDSKSRKIIINVTELSPMILADNIY